MKKIFIQNGNRDKDYDKDHEKDHKKDHDEDHAEHEYGSKHSCRRWDTILKTLKELYRYRQMIFSLVKRDLRGRYKGSVLGFLWTFLNPLLQLVVYSLVFSTIMRAGIEDYYLFLFVGLVPWMFFGSCLTGGTGCIWQQQDMVKKIYFPREVLPIAYVLSQFVNMLLIFIVIFAVLILSGHGLNAAALCYLPAVMLVELILALGMTMILCGMAVYFRDLEYIFSIISMAWMYLTPVMYDMEMVPLEYRNYFSVNPMSPVISAYREILYDKQIPQMHTLLSGLLCGSIILLAGWFVFSVMKRNFAEEL